MSEYDSIPETPKEKNEYFSDLAQSGSVGEAIANAQNADVTQGTILKNGTLEDSIQDGLTLGTPQGMIASVAIGYAKSEICSPKQLAEQIENKRTDGIPVLQAAVLLTEKISSKIAGEEVTFDKTLNATRILDNIVKPIVTGGGSLVADTIYEGGQSVMQISDCMEENNKKKNEYAEIPQTPADMIPDGGYSRAAPPAESFPAPERAPIRGVEMSGPGM